ncbi:MAG: F0F1 ATP synthase subunit epsilon [Bacteroidales bacterium]|nr:F0F1 ATP synthase subunit epsilon [Bacteroidales bacterium]
MTLEIRTPSTSVYTGEVTLVQLPGMGGLFEILEHHAPMVAVLQQGRAKLQDKDGQELFFDLNGGVAEVLHDKILVLAE